MSGIRTGPGRRAALGLVVALLLAAAVDAGMWAVRHGGSGGPVGSANTETRAHGQISQYLTVPAQLPGQATRGLNTTEDSFTGTLRRSIVKIRLAGNGLNGVTSMQGQIRSGSLLLFSDPVAGHGVIAFRTEKNLNRFASLFNRKR